MLCFAMKTRHPQYSGQAQSFNTGFTMVEFLVSIVVLSIGLIGLAGMQLTSLRDNSRAYMRSQASILASDLADRVRANPTTNYTTVAASENSSCSNAPGCSASEMAQHDLFEWNTKLPIELNNGAGLICIDSTPNDGANAGSADCDGLGNNFVIKIWWQDESTNIDGSLPAPQRYIMSFRR